MTKAEKTRDEIHPVRRLPIVTKRWFSTTMTRLAMGYALGGPLKIFRIDQIKN